MSEGISISRPGLLLAGLLVFAGCSGGSGGGVIPGPGSVTLVDVQAQVFSPRCALSGCHIGPGAQMDLDLSAGNAGPDTIGVSAQEIPAMLRVEPGNAADSYLYMKLIQDPRILGDQMPASGGPLSAGQLNLIESWIDQGAN